MLKRTLVIVCGVAGFGIGCRWAAPVKYPIPPGVSSSYNADQRKAAVEYAATFCAVLEQEFGSEGWSSCDKYLSMTQRPTGAPLTVLPAGWRLLLVGGFGSECIADVTVFGDAATHLESAHHIPWTRIQVGAFDSSESNAELIRRAVLKAGTDHPDEKFIGVAHSKGAADWLVAFSKYANDLKRVQALVTVAGAVGGSWLADDFQDLNDKVIKQLPHPPPSCLPSQRAQPSNGIDSMRRQVRQEFLAETTAAVPAFSISAVAYEDTISEILKPLWNRLRPYAREQDSHIVEREAIVPWSTYLGRALGDHWAVAMPFEKTTPPTLPKAINRNHYPRPALLEAAVRMVLRP
jgi:hypothetical protein